MIKLVEKILYKLFNIPPKLPKSLLVRKFYGNNVEVIEDTFTMELIPYKGVLIYYNREIEKFVMYDKYRKEWYIPLDLNVKNIFIQNNMVKEYRKYFNEEKEKSLYTKLEDFE